MLNPTPLLSEDRHYVWGIARSGIHAVAQWIYDAYPDHKLYLISQTYGCEPTSSWEPDSLLFDISKHGRSEQLKCSGQWPADYASPASVLVTTFENHDLMCYSGDDWSRSTILGRSKNVRHVLLLRNLFHHYASYVTASKAHGGLQCYIRHASTHFKNINNFPIDLWKMQAREYFNITDHLPVDVVRLHYDCWVWSAEYRREIASKLGFHTEGFFYQNVPANGGGSSFDYLRYDGAASKMQLLNRWNMIESSEQDKLLHNMDDEVVNLSERLLREFRIALDQSPQR